MRVLTTVLLAVCISFAQKPILPPGSNTALPFSPGIDTGELVYVSGQGARDGKGQLAPKPGAQVRQTLENVKSVLQAAGLTMEHVVYAQVYMTDMKQYETLNSVWSQYFPKDPPARSTIGVARLPMGTPFEVSAVAVRDLATRKVLSLKNRKMPVPVSFAVEVGDRVYLTGGLGRDEQGRVPEAPREQVKLIMDNADAVLEEAKMELRHLVQATVYVSPKMPLPLLAKALEEHIPDETAVTVVQTAALPFGVDLQITGVASRDIERLGKCTAVKDTIYCSGRAGTIRDVLNTFKSELAGNGSSLEKAVKVIVYLDDIDQYAAMNKEYAKFFGKTPPSRTTLQPWKKVPELALPAGTDERREPDDTPRCLVTVIATR
jgi:2-iminobutanoate/2-iminopropanoate deaminase